MVTYPRSTPELGFLAPPMCILGGGASIGVPILHEAKTFVHPLCSGHARAPGPNQVRDFVLKARVLAPTALGHRCLGREAAESALSCLPTCHAFKLLALTGHILQSTPHLSPKTRPADSQQSGELRSAFSSHRPPARAGGAHPNIGGGQKS